jgi:hypothetical protein
MLRTGAEEAGPEKGDEGLWLKGLSGIDIVGGLRLRENGRPGGIIS